MEKEKVKKYKKRDLRLTLEQRMQEYWCDPTIKVTPMEFSRWFRYYCELHGLPDKLLKAKTLPQSLVDSFALWLGYPLREVSTGLKGKRMISSM